MSSDTPSFYDFAKPFFDQLADDLLEDGFGNEAEEVRNILIDPKKRVQGWNEMVLTVPKEFPTISHKKLPTLTATTVKSILKSIEKIEELSSEGKEYYDKFEKLQRKLTNSFLKWLDLLEDRHINKKLVGPGFVIEIFIDFVLNYEGEFESSLLYSESFLCSHFIRKTWAEDKTYLWAPFSLYYFFVFLNIHKIIDDISFNQALESLIEIKDQYYTFYGRYINPNESESVLEDMMFL